MKYLWLICMVLIGCRSAPPENQLQKAVVENDQAKVGDLLKEGVDINACSKWGWNLAIDGETALTAAAKSGHEELVVYLLDRAADINQLDGHGSSAIHNAVFSQKLSLVKYLHAKGADIMLMKDQSASLRLACALHHKEIIQYLVENGVPVNLQGSSNYTALHSGVDSPETIMLLLEMGADKTLKNSCGHTALDLAEKKLKSYEKHGRKEAAQFEKVIQLLK